MKGRLDISGKEEMQFWLRAFQMEMPIEHARKSVNADPAIKLASVPIITEYECGRLYWQLCLCPQVDQLGLKGGDGRIWVSDNQADREQQTEECAELASELLKSFEGRIHESWTGETPKER